jgi:hypothetical protein
MNTCKNCRYWGDGWPVNENESNECGKISLAELHSKDSAFIDVTVSDDSGLNVKFMTVASFSCSLHELSIKPK